MFEAVIIICGVLSGKCYTYYDERGPYLTMQECLARVDQMEPIALALTDQRHIIPEEMDILAMCNPRDPGEFQA